MSIHGISFAEYANKYSQMKLNDSMYLGFRDVPDLLEKYSNGTKTLDFGCGAGKSTAILKELGLKVDGVDINEHMIDCARKALPGVDFQVIQESKIPVKDEHYDLVFSSFVLQLIASKEKLSATLSEIARVMKKDGTFIAVVLSETVYTRDWAHANAEFEENKNLKSGDRAKILFKENNFIIRPYFWTENDYRDVLGEAGLDVILVHEPLGKDGEGFPWTIEKEIPRYSIYVAKKR